MITSFEKYIKEVYMPLNDYEQEKGYGTSFTVNGDTEYKFKRKKSRNKKYKDTTEKSYKKQSL